MDARIPPLVKLEIPLEANPLKSRILGSAAPAAHGQRQLRQAERDREPATRYYRDCHYTTTTTITNGITITTTNQSWY